MKISVLLIVVLIAFPLLSQYHKRVLFDSLKVYHYNAFYINELGDTLTKEKVVFKPTGSTWKFDKTQDLVKIFYSPNDSIVSKLKNHKDKKNKKTKILLSKEERTGLIETDSEIWIHPFRNNQYALTEIAPFPELKMSNLKIGNIWDGGILFIMTGWGALKGKVKSKYEVVDLKQITFENNILFDCWEIKGIGIHSKLGENTITYIFQKDIGFLNMKYHFYNGYQILFELDKIERLEL